MHRLQLTVTLRFFGISVSTVRTETSAYLLTKSQFRTDPKLLSNHQTIQSYLELMFEVYRTCFDALKIFLAIASAIRSCRARTLSKRNSLQATCARVHRASQTSEVRALDHQIPVNRNQCHRTLPVLPPLNQILIGPSFLLQQ